MVLRPLVPPDLSRFSRSQELSSRLLPDAAGPDGTKSAQIPNRLLDLTEAVGKVVTVWLGRRDYDRVVLAPLGSGGGGDPVAVKLRRLWSSAAASSAPAARSAATRPRRSTSRAGRSTGTQPSPEPDRSLPTVARTNSVPRWWGSDGPRRAVDTVEGRQPTVTGCSRDPSRFEPIGPETEVACVHVGQRNRRGLMSPGNGQSRRPWVAPSNAPRQTATAALTQPEPLRRDTSPSQHFCSEFQLASALRI